MEKFLEVIESLFQQQWFSALVGSITTIGGSIVGAVLTWVFGIKRKKKIKCYINHLSHIYKGESGQIVFHFDILFSNNSLHGRTIFDINLLIRSNGFQDLTKKVIDMENFSGLSHSFIFQDSTTLFFAPEQSNCFRARITFAKEETLYFEKIRKTYLTFKNEKGKLIKIKIDALTNYFRGIKHE